MLVERIPDWLRRPPGSAKETREVKKLLRASSLNTVCEEARCPNISECFGRGTATFMILGDVCTRGCRFCSVITGRPEMSEQTFDAEGLAVAEAAEKLNLKHVVVTSVARDDLKDGGASGFVKTIRALRSRLPEVTVEILVPDFLGNESALETVLAEEPDVFNHNLETVARLYRRVRPGASYQRSLKLLQDAAEYSERIVVKTGIMLGLGEEEDEVIQLFSDARASGVRVFTAGQYMRPGRDYLGVVEYLPPDKFALYQSKAEEAGFETVTIEPLARSSYRAETQLAKVREEIGRAS